MKIKTLNLKKKEYYTKIDNVIQEFIPEVMTVHYNNGIYSEHIITKINNKPYAIITPICETKEDCLINKYMFPDLELEIEVELFKEDCKIYTYILDEFEKVKKHQVDSAIFLFEPYLNGVIFRNVDLIDIKHYYKDFSKALMFSKDEYVTDTNETKLIDGYLNGIYLTDKQEEIVKTFKNVIKLMAENNIEIGYDYENDHYYLINSEKCYFDSNDKYYVRDVLNPNLDFYIPFRQIYDETTICKK